MITWISSIVMGIPNSGARQVHHLVEEAAEIGVQEAAAKAEVGVVEGVEDGVRVSIRGRVLTKTMTVAVV
jgi:hypothetical protein